MVLSIFLIIYGAISTFLFTVHLGSILTTGDASTGVAPCLVGQNGESAIVIVSGANLLLTPEEIQATESVISGAKVIVCQLEITAQATLAALRLAKQHGGESANIILVCLLICLWLGMII